MTQKGERGWKGEELGEHCSGGSRWVWATTAPRSAPTLYRPAREPGSTPNRQAACLAFVLAKFPLPVGFGGVRWAVLVCKRVEVLAAALETTGG